MEVHERVQHRQRGNHLDDTRKELTLILQPVRRHQPRHGVCRHTLMILVGVLTPATQLQNLLGVLGVTFHHVHAVVQPFVKLLVVVL